MVRCLLPLTLATLTPRNEVRFARWGGREFMEAGIPVGGSTNGAEGIKTAAEPSLTPPSSSR